MRPVLSVGPALSDPKITTMVTMARRPRWAATNNQHSCQEFNEQYQVRPYSTSRHYHLLVTQPDGSHSRSRSADYFGRNPSSRSSSPSNFASTPATSILNGTTPGEQIEWYTKLLTVVVDAARNLAAVPQSGLHRSVTEIPAPLTLDQVDLAVRGSDRNAQIGAAGELFVSLIFTCGPSRPLILSGLRMAQVIEPT